MAGRRNRSEKSVLSRQEIAGRRRQLTDKKLSTDNVGRRAVAGVFVLAFAVLALVSVATFDAADRSGPGFRNAVGPVGHALAEGLRGLLGLCAYLVPAVGLYVAAALFVGNRRRRWPQIASAALLALGLAILLQLGLGAEPGWSHPPGGSVGEALATVLSGLFSTVGTVILVSAVCAAALIVGTQFVFLKLCAATWRGAISASQSAARNAAALWQSQQRAWRARKEAAARAKLEEAAFFAQLEADEESLAEQEREIAEAEAIAEEADRLAREAHKKHEAEAAAKVARKDAVKQRPEPAAPVLSDQRPEPGKDPVWASQLQPTAPNPAPTTDDAKKRRKIPQIVTGPEPVPAPTPAAGAPQPAPTPSHAESAPQAPSPHLAIARMPVIIEPKAPPRPTKKKEQEQFEFADGRTAFTLPPCELLAQDKKERSALDKEAFLSTAEKLRAKLADFGIVGEVVEIRPGPVVTMYEFLPGPGIKVSKIASLADDLAMAMEAMRVRIVAPIPGKGVVGIEVPNKDREMVFLKEIAEQDAFTKSVSRLTMCLGKDIEGMPYVLDLAKAPHLLMAGTTGSGKSVAVNAMIMSILLKSTPEEVRFIMVDPKMLELSVYEGIPHLLLPVVTDPKKAALALRWAVEEMERRYHLLSEAGVRNIAGYNKLMETADAEGRALLGRDSKKAQVAAAISDVAPKAPGKKLIIVDVGEDESEEEALQRSQSAEALGVAAPKEPPEEIREALAEAEAEAVEPESVPRSAESEAEELAAHAQGTAEEKKELRKLPYIVVIIDELADLMMVASREVETYIARLAQMARAAGIHLMVATQRPSTDVVTGVIKANFPTRISFMLRSKPDSMTILGTIGAEALLGMGDMLIMPPTSAHMQRVHGAYVSEAEIAAVVDHLKAQGKPVYDDSILKAREEEAEGGGEEDELSDELYDQAMAVVADMKQVSISMLQRKMRIGYNRAARMIERMERDGVVGPADGARPREVLLRPLGEMPGAGAM
jgi:DNA segregation ATPase FtsK/SpoIIIE, S-DNA-T family